MKKILLSNRIGVTLMLVAFLFSAMVCRAQEVFQIEECQPAPCTAIQSNKTKMPVPCNCVPKVAKLDEVRVSIKAMDASTTKAKIITSTGQVYASTDQRPGTVSFDRASETATLSFGVVNKDLAGKDLKIVITTIGTDKKTPKETVVKFGE